MFSEHVCARIGIYVYRLIDPRDRKTFYVGKGRGNRMFTHALGVVPSDEDDISAKISRIRSIKAAGFEVAYIVHRHGLVSDEVAFEVEAALIDAYPGLSNGQRGHYSSDFGAMDAGQITALYELAELPETTGEKLVLINVNKSLDEAGRKDFYSRVRFAWRISRERAEEADYVCAVVRGVIRGVFVAQEWLPATKENFPEFAHIADPPEQTKRYGFVGQEAPLEVWSRLVDKRLPDRYRHERYPIRYFP